MKKILIIFFLVSASTVLSQGKTDTLGNTKISLTTIYNSIFPVGSPNGTVTKMSDTCQYYTVTINAVVDTTAIKVSFVSGMTPNFRTHSGDNYLGEFKASSFPNIYFQSWFTVASTFSYTVKFIKIIR